MHSDVSRASFKDLGITTVYYWGVCMLTNPEAKRVVFPCGVNCAERTKSLLLKGLV